MPRKQSGPTYEPFGAYVRSQRQLARLSLRQAAAMARISNPYLSQIEHGLALPSVTVISALADALQVSADNLLLLAAGMDPDDTPIGSRATEHAIRHDRRLDDSQKHALLAVLASFVEPAAHESSTLEAATSQAEAPEPDAPHRGPTAAITRAPRLRQLPTALADDRKSHGKA